MKKAVTAILLIVCVSPLFGQNKQDSIVTDKKDVFIGDILLANRKLVFINRDGIIDSVSTSSIKRLTISDKSKIENNYDREVLSPPEGKCLIYLYRPASIVNALVSAKIQLNGKLVSKLGNNSFTKLAVPAGSHTLMWRNDKHLLNIDVKEGQVYFVQVDQTGSISRMDAFGGCAAGGVNFYLTIIPNDLGELYMKSIKNEMYSGF